MWLLRIRFFPAKRSGQAATFRWAWIGHSAKARRWALSGYKHTTERGAGGVAVAAIPAQIRPTASALARAPDHIAETMSQFSGPPLFSTCGQVPHKLQPVLGVGGVHRHAR
jgi:hypothetical protein